MRGLKSVFLAIVAAACFFVVAQAACSVATPQDCKGPVGRVYSNSDCSGTPNNLYQTFSGNLSQCNEDGAGYWTMTTCGEDGLVATEYSDAACTIPIYRGVTSVTQCFSRGSNSYSYACSVNDTTTYTVSSANTSLPTSELDGYDCGSLENCTRDTEAFAVYYNSEVSPLTCDAANITGFWAAARTSANFSLGNCLYWPSQYSNMLVTCTSEELIYSYYQNGVGCVGAPTDQEIYSRSCGADWFKKKKKRDGLLGYDTLTTSVILCPSVDVPVATPSSSPSDSPSAPSAPSAPVSAPSESPSNSPSSTGPSSSTPSASTVPPAPTSSSSSLRHAALVIVAALLFLGA